MAMYSSFEEVIRTCTVFKIETYFFCESQISIREVQERFFISWTPVKNVFSWTPVKYFKIDLGSDYNLCNCKDRYYAEVKQTLGKFKKCFSWMPVNKAVSYTHQTLQTKRIG